MIELIRSWLTGIACAAMVAALADVMMPEGAVRRVGVMAGGLVMMLAVVRPVMQVDFAQLSAEGMFAPAAYSEYSGDLEAENTRLMKDIISQQTCAYIQGKAAEMGLSIATEVTFWEEGKPYPAEIKIYGDLGQEDMLRLSKMIENDLTIPIQKQIFERTEET